MDDDLIGKRVRVRFEDNDRDFYYTISDVIDNSGDMFTFKDKYGVVKGVNKKYIKEIY